MIQGMAEEGLQRWERTRGPPCSQVPPPQAAQIDAKSKSEESACYATSFLRLIYLFGYTKSQLQPAGSLWWHVGSLAAGCEI